MTSARLCSIPECGKKHYSKGLCSAHYLRLLAHGDPLAGRTPEGEPELFYQNTVLQYNGDDCITWPYARDKEGYGRIKRDGKRKFVHRLVCEDINGPPPTPEHQAAHSCGRGNLACVTKGHLSWKTPKENQADRLEHGTHCRGERNGSAKLTEAQVLEIRSFKGQFTVRQIAEKYGVSQSTVAGIYSGDRWAWLDSTQEVVR